MSGPSSTLSRRSVLAEEKGPGQSIKILTKGNKRVRGPEGLNTSIPGGGARRVRSEVVRDLLSLLRRGSVECWTTSERGQRDPTEYVLVTV